MLLKIYLKPLITSDPSLGLVRHTKWHFIKRLQEILFKTNMNSINVTYRKIAERLTLWLDGEKLCVLKTTKYDYYMQEKC